MCFSKPTCFKASLALSFLSEEETPDKVKASSTLDKTL